METYLTATTDKDVQSVEALRLEAVTTCVGFDDMLDVTLKYNHPHVDTMIVVTSHEDKATQLCARKHGVICVETGLFHKNGRGFNKGAGINAGFNYWQYHGWRLHLDCDIVLPDQFRRILFDHTVLDQRCLYGADRVDIVGADAPAKLKPQNAWGYFVSPPAGLYGSRFVHRLYGYEPIGYFQLWHCSTQKDYPYSLGAACKDDVMFADQYQEEYRRLLPSVIVAHLTTGQHKMGSNWNGRTTPRLKKEI